MRTQLQVEKEVWADAIIHFVVGLVLIGLGVYRVAHGDWVAGSILLVGGCHLAV